MERLREGLPVQVLLQVNSVDTEEGVVKGLVQDLGLEVCFPVSDFRLGMLLTGMEEDGGLLKATINKHGMVLTLSNFQAVPSVDRIRSVGDLPGMFHPHRGSRNRRHSH